MEEKSFAITHAYRESRFLFAIDDGIYKTLGEIQQNGATILAFEKYKYEKENNLTPHRLESETLHKNACQARLDFQKNLEKVLIYGIIKAIFHIFHYVIVILKKKVMSIVPYYYF